MDEIPFYIHIKVILYLYERMNNVIYELFEMRSNYELYPLYMKNFLELLKTCTITPSEDSPQLYKIMNRCYRTLAGIRVQNECVLLDGINNQFCCHICNKIDSEPINKKINWYTFHICEDCNKLDDENLKNIMDPFFVTIKNKSFLLGFYEMCEYCDSDVVSFTMDDDGDQLEVVTCVDCYNKKMTKQV